MNFFLLTNVKMPTFMNGKNSILDLSEPKKAEFPDIFFILMSILYSCSVELITSGPGWILAVLRLSGR